MNRNPFNSVILLYEKGISKNMANSSFRFAKDLLLQFHVLMPLIMLLGVGLVFFPFGFSQVGLIEEWGELGVFTEHGPISFITKHSPFAAFRMRPLNMLPASLGYQLDPDSFFYWHTILFLSIWLKGIGLAFILWWLYPQRWIAILGGLLLMVYPADTMQLVFRSIHINSAVASTLCAVALLLWASQVKELWARAILACCASVLFLCACLIYEAAILLAPIPLLLWWAKYGIRDGWRTLKIQRIVVLFWFITILIELGYLLWISGDPDLYQSSFSNPSGNILNTIFQYAPMLLTVGFYRTFLHSWYDAGRMLLTLGDWVIFLPIVVLPILVLVLCLKAKDYEPGNKTLRLDSGLLTRWLVVSILITALGYSPYLVALSHILITQRTYLFAGVGGALVCTALIAILRTRFRWFGAGVGGGLLLLGFAAQWTQFAHYKVISDQQKAILSGILEAAPRLDSQQNLLIIDHTGSLGSTWMLRGEILSSALTYLYGKKTEVVICLEPGLVRSSFATDSVGRTGRCEEGQDAWQIGQGAPGSFSLPKTHLVTLIIEQDGQVHPHTINTDIPPATSSEQARWSKVLGCWPAKACRGESQRGPLPDHFEFDFGQWWSMEKPTPGVGWRDSQWMAPAWQPRSFAWINQPKSTLLFQLAPRPVPYLLHLGLAHIISEAAKERLKVYLNGHPIHHEWLDAMHAQAKINPSWLKEGVNELLFLTDVDPAQGVSLSVEYVKVEPQKID